MQTNKRNYNKVFSGDFDWFQKIEAAGELEINCNDFEDAAFKAAGVDAGDEESWCGLVTYAHPEHIAVRAGDYAVCQGVGSEVVFVRAANGKDAI